MSAPTRSIRLNVQTVYIEEQSTPEANQYVFAYTITIHNTGTIPARLLSRHWVITDANGNVREVRGEGVIGAQPYLRPGEAFQYTSAAMIETPVGSMHGSYYLVADDGINFEVPIAAFGLSVPCLLH